MSEVVVIEWSTIPVDVKTFIVSFLDYESRCNLRTCSKSDQSLVDSTRFVPDFIAIEEQRTSETSVLRFESRTIAFTETDGVVTLSREWIPMGNERFKGKKRDVMIGFIEGNWMRNGRLEAKRIEILNVAFEPKEHWILECDELKLRMLGSKRLPVWLQKTVPNLKELEVMEWGIEGISETPQVQNTRHCLRMSRDACVSDEQLSTLRAPSLVIFSSNTISEKGAKKAFKKYVEEARRGDPFELKFSKPATFDHRELFQKTWNVEEIENSDDTEGFFMYQITGGFQNVHRISEVSQVVVFDFSTYMTLKVRNL